MRMGTVAVGIISIAVLGYTWLHFHDQRVREQQAAQASMDSLRLAVAAERAERGARYTRDSIASLRAVQARDAALAAARTKSDSVSGEFGRLLDSLGAILPDTLEPFVERITAQYNELQRTYERTLAAADSAIAVRDSIIGKIESTYDYDVSILDAQIYQCLAQLNRAIKRTNPGLLTRVSRALPWIAGAYIVGKLSK